MLYMSTSAGTSFSLPESRISGGCYRSTALCFSRNGDLGRHHSLFPVVLQVTRMQQAHIAELNCKMLQSKEMPNEKIPKCSLLNCLQSA